MKDDHHASIPSCHIPATAVAGLPVLGAAVSGSASLLQPAAALRMAGPEQLPPRLLPAGAGGAANLAAGNRLAAHRGDSDSAI